MRKKVFKTEQCKAFVQTWPLRHVKIVDAAKIFHAPRSSVQREVNGSTSAFLG
jgi:hypothetical protein